MRVECQIKVGKVLGRKLTDEEGRKVVDSLKYAMRTLRNTEPSFGSLTQSQQIQKAAELIASQIQEEARVKVRNRNLQVLAQAKKYKEMKRLRDEDGVVAYKGIAKILVNADNYNRGVMNSYMNDLADLFNGIDSKLFGLLEDPESAYNFVRSAFGEKSTAISDKAYSAWKKVGDALFERCRNAGLISGKIDRYLPQNHDWYKLSKAGVKQWVADIKPLLDRSRFMNEDGSPMRDLELDELLTRAFKNIVTDGNPESAFDIEGQIKAHRSGSRFEIQHRVLHFKNADAWFAYHSKYGRGSLTEVLMSHIRRLSHDAGMLEQFGPDPEATYQFMKSIAETEANHARLDGTSLAKDFKYSDRVGLLRANIDDVWANVTGAANRVGSPNKESLLAHYGADFMQGWRNLEVAGKLGKAFITSLSDIPTYLMASGFHNIAWSDRIAMLPKAFGSEWRDYATRLGIISDTITGDFNRWSGDNIGNNWTAKVADATMRASLLTAWTDGIRRAFSLNLMAAFAKMSKLDWNSLEAGDRARLIDGGITADDWIEIRKAGSESFKGIEFFNVRLLQEINPQVASKLLGYIVKENEMASLGPSVVTRAGTNRGYAKGTWGGELSRSFWLFKSFPASFMEKQMERAKWLHRYGTKADVLEYAAFTIVGTTMLGAVSLQITNLLNGKDARDMETPGFWLEAMAKGGGLGFAGDFLANQFSEDPSMGSWGAIQMAGPVATTALEATDLLTSSLNKALYGNDIKVGAKAVKLVRGHTPFVNMWYTSAALDRAVMNKINEALSPGYTRKMEKRARKLHGQGYWWSPTHIERVRAPRFAKEPNR